MPALSLLFLFRGLFRFRALSSLSLQCSHQCDSNGLQRDWLPVFSPLFFFFQNCKSVRIGAHKFWQLYLCLFSTVAIKIQFCRRTNGIPACLSKIHPTCEHVYSGSREIQSQTFKFNFHVICIICIISCYIMYETLSQRREQEITALILLSFATPLSTHAYFFFSSLEGKDFRKPHYTSERREKN